MVPCCHPLFVGSSIYQHTPTICIFCLVSESYMSYATKPTFSQNHSEYILPMDRLCIAHVNLWIQRSHDENMSKHEGFFTTYEFFFYSSSCVYDYQTSQVKVEAKQMFVRVNWYFFISKNVLSTKSSCTHPENQHSP